MKNFDQLRVESFEGDTEHAIAEQLVQEINATATDDEWVAKVTVLAESVEHHIEEEEEEILKKIELQIPEATRLKIGAEYSFLINDFVQLNTIQPPHNVRFDSAGIAQPNQRT